MIRLGPGLVFALLAWPPTAAAQPLELRPAKSLSYTEIGVGHVHESVSNQPQPWTDTSLELLHKFADRKVLIGRLNETERFGLRDTTASIAGYHPLGKDTTFYAELSASDSHRVLPRDSLHLQLTHAIGQGWGAIGGIKRVHYDNTTVETADVALEYYFSNFRAALTLLPSRSSTAGSASSARLQLGYFYGTENNVQLVVASGDEVETPVAAGVIVRTHVSSKAIYGRHWFARDWAFTYHLGRTKQGVSTREAAGIGLRYRF